MFSSQSPHSISLDNETKLELIDDRHAEPLLSIVNRNRPYLGQWLPWVDYMQTEENFQAYISRCKRQLEAGTDVGYVILYKNNVAGRIGIHYIDLQNKLGAIGYWIGEEFSGKGLVTKSCQAVISMAFHQLGLNRIELKCAVENKRSAAVAERLHFTLEGVLREAELVNGKYLNLNLYSLLKKDCV